MFWILLSFYEMRRMEVEHETIETRIKSRSVVVALSGYDRVAGRRRNDIAGVRHGADGQYRGCGYRKL